MTEDSYEIDTPENWALRSAITDASARAAGLPRLPSSVWVSVMRAAGAFARRSFEGLTSVVALMAKQSA